MKTPCFVLALFSLMLLSCKKHDVQPVNQLSLLPAATQTGANTFGCLVNGAAFVPKNTGFAQGVPYKCQYIFTPQSALFYIDANVGGNDGSVSNVAMRTDSLNISQGETLPLSQYNTSGMAYGTYDLNLLSYQTNANVTGEMTITHLDMIKQIVSGTFQYNAVSKARDTVKITNGRFDVHYTL